MRRVHEKSIILGIGIGMVITSIAGLIYSASADTGTQADKLSKEEIIRLAKNYDLVERVPLIDDPAASTQTNKAVESSKTNETSTATAEKTAVVAKKTPSDNSGGQATAKSNGDERNITIVIEEGYDSKKVINLLYEKGIISDRTKFKAVMDSYNATRKIDVGDFSFKKNDDYRYIVETICTLK